MFDAFFIALGLNFDTFSVAIVEGSQVVRPTIKDSLKVGIFFGTGQALLALIGSFLGIGFKLYISNIDHWIAFALLSFIGVKLIKDSGKSQSYSKKNNTLDFRNLTLLAIATSIDALIVGVTLAFIKTSIIINIIVIGLLTFIVSSIGFYAGEELKKISKSRTKIIGGIILIIIGTKILVEHIYFGG